MLSALISWPDGFDFPLFRKNLEKLKRHVDEVVICFTHHGNASLKEWLRQNLQGCVLLDVDTYTQLNYQGDWRSQSTNRMIDAAQGDWLLSLEQDFFIKDYDTFFSTVKKAMDNYDVIMFPETNRFHPACLFVKKDILKRTRRDFSTNGTGVDHFAMVTDDLKGMSRYVDLHTLGLEERRDWLHMRGLTDNYFAPKPYFDSPSFHVYNNACLSITPISDYWMSEMIRCKKYEEPTISSKLQEFV